MEFDNPLDLNIELKPGVVYFFAPDTPLSDDWQHYVGRLEMIMRRRGLDVKVVPAPRADVTYYTVARLYNIGNLTSQAYAWISGSYGPVTATASLESLVDRLVWVTYSYKGSIDVTESPNMVDCCMMPMDPSGDECPTASPGGEPKSIWSKFRKSFRCVDESRPEEDEDEDFLEHLDRERRDIINRIGVLITEYVRQYHEMPPLDMFKKPFYGKFILPQSVEGFSPVVVNGNLDIVLPQYNEIVLKMTPLPKIVYLLFLKHPEGLRLKDISDYSRELEELYLLVKPGSNEHLAASSIADLCTPGSESLNQKISMIKRCVRKQLEMPGLVDHYTISGRRGELYRLPAAVDCTLPAILA